MQVRLHIAELVLHGVPPAQRHAVADAVRAELQRRLQSGPLPQAWAAGGHIEALAAPRAAVPHGASAAGTGRAIASALHTGLTAGDAGERR